MRRISPPLFASPGEVDGAIINELDRRARRIQSDPRKKAQHRRWLISRNQHEPLIRESIGELQKHPDIARLIQEHISTCNNPAQDVIRDICTVYKKAVIRRLSGVSEPTLSAFRRIVKESKIDALGPRINRDAYFIGPVAVTPRLHRSRLRLEVIQPQSLEVVHDELDPLGHPVAIAFALSDAADAGTGADLCVIDGTSRRYFRRHEASQELTEIPRLREDHNLGYCPVAILRFDVPEDVGDWHDAFRHKRLEDGAIDVGRISAHRDYVRRVQNRIILAIAGDLSSLAQRQTISDPELPLVFPLGKEQDANTSIDISALAFSQDPEHFQKDIRDKVEAMARSTGVPHIVNSSDHAWGVQWDWSALTELRQEQIAFCREFEYDLWVTCADYARVMRHPVHTDLPTQDEILSGLMLEFGRLSRRSADPKEEREWNDWALSKGVKSFLDVLRDEFPNLDNEQLRDILNANIDENTSFWDALAKRNATLDPLKMGVQSAPQAYGAMGTPAREANDNSE